MIDFSWGAGTLPLRTIPADDGPVIASIEQGVEAVEPGRPEQRAQLPARSSARDAEAGALIVDLTGAGESALRLRLR